MGANFVAVTTKHQVSVARFGLKALGVFPAHSMVLGAWFGASRACSMVMGAQVQILGVRCSILETKTLFRTTFEILGTTFRALETQFKRQGNPQNQV